MLLSIHWNPDPELFRLFGSISIRYYGLLWLLGLTFAYFIVRYQYRERDYFVVLDGVSGDPVSGRAPGDQTYQALAAGLGAGFGGLFAGLGVAYAVFSNSEYALAGLSGLVIGLILVLAGYWMFRFGSEVTEGKLTGGVTFSMKGFGQKTVREIER